MTNNGATPKDHAQNPEIIARLQEAMDTAHEEALNATHSTPKLESFLRWMVANGDETTMMQLLERGVVNVDGREEQEGGEGDTALHVAARGGELACLKRLLAAGADMELKASRAGGRRAASAALNRCSAR